MRLSYGSSAVSATFDDPNLVSAAGLAPVVALAQSCGLADLVADRLTLKAAGEVNAQLKVPALRGVLTSEDGMKPGTVHGPSAVIHRFQALLQLGNPSQ